MEQNQAWCTVRPDRKTRHISYGFAAGGSIFFLVLLALCIIEDPARVRYARPVLLFLLLNSALCTCGGRRSVVCI